jgi:hypothetical protein
MCLGLNLQESWGNFGGRAASPVDCVDSANDDSFFDGAPPQQGKDAVGWVEGF